ncbi:HAD family hydrolase [Streptomyces chiangmaiensis]
MSGPIAVLFDIDETLIHTGGSGARSWTWAFDHLHGVAADIGEHSSAGETDPQVGRETFRAVIGREPSCDELGRLYTAYLCHLAEDIWTSKEYRVLDGVEETLQQLAEAGVTLGLLSGAMEGAARIKMEPAKLGRYFVFGAYGSDSPDRGDCPAGGSQGGPAARPRTDSQRGIRRGRHPRDIEAALRANATPIGVATGHYTVPELRATKADHVLTSLTEPFPGL